MMAKNPKQQITLLGKKLFELKRNKKELEAQVSGINKQIIQLATIDLPKLMEDSEIQNVQFKGMGTMYLADELFMQVKKEDRPKLFKWMRKHGHGDLIVDWVFPRTLSAWAKEQLANGDPLPEKIMEARIIPTAKTRSINSAGEED